MGCPRKKPSSSESEDEEQVEQSSCLYWPDCRVSEEVLEEPRLSLSRSPLRSRVSSRGRSDRGCRWRLSAPG